MHPENESKLEQRVVRAAEAALADHQYVSTIDVLVGMGLLPPSNVQAWKQGHVEYLEAGIQANLSKISLSIALFHRWAEAKGLKSGETRYVRKTRAGTLNLRFSISGDPGIEKSYQTHYVSPELSERKKEKLEERLAKDPEPVVFEILRDSRCSECDAELPSGSFLTMEGQLALCLPCAGLGELEYLPAGDTALTRRAGKYSGQKAVVVRFSRSRGRYERQGILVEKGALEQAEAECTEDAGQRANARARAAEQRLETDRELVARMTERLAELFPRCPPAEAREIAAHAAVRGSGRVGRTAAGQNLEKGALTAAVTAAVRHRQTNYDELLAAGVERADARERVLDRVHEILEKWR